MKKILLLTLMVLTACQAAKTKNVSTETQTSPVETSTVKSATRIVGTVELPSKPMLTVLGCTNCQSEELERIMAGVAKLNEIAVTKCFRDGMENRPLIQTNGLTPSQVVDLLVHADIKIHTEMYWTLKRVLGYTLPGQNPEDFKEWLNRRYMLSWNVCDLASLLAHETSHKAGFEHDFNPTIRRPNSVPYAINAVFSTCCVK